MEITKTNLREIGFSDLIHYDGAISPTRMFLQNKGHFQGTFDKIEVDVKALSVELVTEEADNWVSHIKIKNVSSIEDVEETLKFLKK